MVNRTHLVLRADDRSYFAILKKEIHSLATSAGFSEGRVGEIDIVVAEMASNLVKHAGGGQILVKLVEDQHRQGIEILSIDNGQGMNDITRMVSDGISTKNTLGHGLGAMKRLADVFQVFSLKDWGTIILVRMFNEELPFFRKPAVAEVKAIVLPKPGEEKCGDGYKAIISKEFVKIFLGDGLGHGKEAAEAVEKAMESFESCPESDPVEIIRFISNEVRKTRGLVGTVAIFDLRRKAWKICGVGNIATRIISINSSKNYMTYNGIIGSNLPRTMNTQEMQHEKGHCLVMCSDGLKSRWDMIKYPSIIRYDLSILSAALWKDFARHTDDMSVLTCKINA